VDWGGEEAVGECLEGGINMLPILFNFEGQELRTVIKNGEPEFVAKDACLILELDDVSKAVSRLDDDEKGTNLIPTLGGNQEMLCVNEYGLYSLIIGSRKPEAKAFKRWITHEVIPSIRKTGSYSTESKSNRKLLPQPDLPKIAKSIKASIAISVALGMPLYQARAKAIEITERDFGIDLSEFKPTPSVMVTPGRNTVNLTPILEAIHAVISNPSGIHRDFGGGSYALDRDRVYRELDARGLNRKRSLGTLCDAGILERGGMHFTKHLKVGKSNVIRAVFVRLKGAGGLFT